MKTLVIIRTMDFNIGSQKIDFLCNMYNTDGSESNSHKTGDEINALFTDDYLVINAINKNVHKIVFNEDSVLNDVGNEMLALKLYPIWWGKDSFVMVNNIANMRSSKELLTPQQYNDKYADHYSLVSMKAIKVIHCYESLAIEEMNSGKFMLSVNRDEFTFDTLELAEETLWNEFAQYEWK